MDETGIFVKGEIDVTSHEHAVEKGCLTASC